MTCLLRPHRHAPACSPRTPHIASSGFFCLLSFELEPAACRILCNTLQCGCCLQRTEFVVMQANTPPGARHMAQWYPADHQVIHQPQQQQQQQQQAWHHSGIAHGALPHLACFIPPPYPAAQYPAYSTPAAFNGMSHIWLPVQINCDAAPYPGFYRQMHYPHSLHPGQPYREARRPAAASSSQARDSLQMAWPDSPVSAQPFSHHHQQGSADCAPARQQVSRPAPCDRKATPPQPSASADSLRHSQQPQTPLNKQPAHLALCDDTASSYSTASPGKANTTATSSVPAEHQASSESAKSADSGVSTSHASDDTHLTAAADDERVVDNGLEPAWHWLALGLLRDIMAQLPPHCRPRCRLVCKQWRATMDLSVQVFLDTCLSYSVSRTPCVTIWCTAAAWLLAMC